MNLKEMLEFAGVDVTKGKAKELVEAEANHVGQLTPKELQIVRSTWKQMGSYIDKPAKPNDILFRSLSYEDKFVRLHTLGFKNLSIEQLRFIRKLIEDSV